MRHPVIIALKARRPLFPEKPLHSFAPLNCRTAGAGSKGQGRPSADASREPLTAASTLTGWRHSGDRARSRYAVLLFTAVLSLGSGSAMAVAQSTPILHPAAVDPYAAHITEASQRFGIPGDWIRAVLCAESAGDERAISSVGAMGLMQVMPDTWAGLRARYGLGRDPYEPRDNILAGTAYLREMWDRYGNVAAMLAAYNAGPGRYDEYLATGRVLPAETRAYVAALVPVLASEATSDPPVAAPPPPPDWREASLFVMRSADTRTAVASPSDDTRATVPVRDLTDTEPRAGSIFVARASDEGTP
ncbi:MAG: lytic transglycosylase domain-containing protein [Pseudomonadota bacterium]|nr:lytic transglycosylase domain-containing protein [Pseudomonadota bacterium]